MIVLSETGDFVREFPATDGTLTGLAETAVCSRTGVILFQGAPRVTGAMAAERTAVVSGTASLWFLENAGQVPGRISSMPAGEYVVIGGGSGPRPLGRSILLALGPKRAYVAASDTDSLNVFSLDGKQLGSIGLSLPGRRTTPLHFERAIEDIVSNIRGSRMSSLVRGEMQKLPRPPLLPRMSGLAVDDDGLIWIVTSVAGDPTTSFVVVDSAGKRVATVDDAPINVKVTDVGRDYILGVHTDTNGVARIVSFGLDRSTSILRP
jgi:hypothetical protein